MANTLVQQKQNNGSISTEALSLTNSLHLLLALLFYSYKMHQIASQDSSSILRN